jgi:diguanylate cyclase (GGDEF)-like protein
VLGCPPIADTRVCRSSTRRPNAATARFYESRQHAPAPALYLVELLAAEIGPAIYRTDLVALLAAQSRRDPLTGPQIDAAGMRSWTANWLEPAEPGDARTVAIIDMVHFKAFNDTFGHLAGDTLLTDLVSAFRAELRTADVIARWGGEEFALALPDCNLQQAQLIASRLLNVVPGGQTASIGLTQARTQDTPRAMIERADRALYAAKAGGRNQIKAFHTPPPS